MRGKMSREELVEALLRELTKRFEADPEALGCTCWSGLGSCCETRKRFEAARETLDLAGKGGV